MDTNTYTQICIELNKINSLYNREKCIFEYYDELIEIKKITDVLQDKTKYEGLKKTKFIIKKLLSHIEIKNPQKFRKQSNYHNNNNDDYYYDNKNENHIRGSNEVVHFSFTVQPWTGDPNICIFD
jgi:hypothetical protein